MDVQETTVRDQQIHEAIDLLIHTMRLHHRIVEKRVEGCGVHHSQHRMLMKLARMGPAASQKDIAEHMDVSPACVARTLKSLSAAGLVQRAEGSDARCNAVDISPRGRQIVDESIKLFLQIGTDMFAGLSEAETTQLIAMLSRLKANLSAMERESAADENEANDPRKEKNGL